MRVRLLITAFLLIGFFGIGASWSGNRSRSTACDIEANFTSTNSATSTNPLDSPAGLRWRSDQPAHWRAMMLRQ